MSVSLPQSFISNGFKGIKESRIRPKLWGLNRHGIMIGTDGQADTGKTEFIFSCPGPGIVLALDRGTDGILENRNPPTSRRSDFAIKEMALPNQTQALQDTFKTLWEEYRIAYNKALTISEARTVATDGDSDGWELQRLAEFGKLAGVPQLNYQGIKAARRAHINKAYDSGKVIVCTHKVEAEWISKRDANGQTMLDTSGKPMREKSGRLVRQGFDDDDYLFQIQLSHFYSPASTVTNSKGKQIEVAAAFGIEITKCKFNRALVGMKLMGDDCNFAGLVSVVFPDVPLSDWGL